MVSLYWGTVGYIKAESDALVDKELSYFTALEDGGIPDIAREIFERSGQPNRPFYYYLEDENGQKIAGIFPKLPAEPVGKITSVIFDVIIADEVGNLDTRAASGKIAEIAGGHLLVAHDAEQQRVMVERFTRTIIIFAFASLAISFFGGLIMSRYAARRAEILTDTTQSIIQGDLTKRVEINAPGDEFDRLGAHINTMLNQLEKLVERARNSGNALAHDLRSPLSRLRNRLERAQMKDHTAESAREVIGASLEQTDRILKMFNAILGLSNIGAGMAGKFNKVDVTELLEELSELFEPSAADAELQFNADVEKNLSVMGSRTLLAQALSNLIDNAIKYTPAGGQITLQATQTNDAIILSVADTGPGIPDDEVEHVKQRFVRLDSARSAEGSGLGLTLVDAVVEAHNGVFKLNEPKPQKGLLASIILPKTVASRQALDT